jgi:hypothetical protein
MASKWTRQRVGIEVRKRKRAGLPLNDRAVRNLAIRFHALRLFGSWGAAIRSAGIDYEGIRKYKAWTKAFILDWIRRLKQDDVNPYLRALPGAKGL